MRTFVGVIVGLLLFFPGILLLQWLAVNVLGLYDAMTLTDGCLVMIIILLSVNLMVMTRSARAPRRHRSVEPSPYEAPEPYLQYLNSSTPPSRRRRSSRRRDDTQR